MGPKKGLSAFIKSQKTTKDKKTTGTTEEKSSAPTTGDQIKSADAEVQQTQNQNAKNTPANKKAESSDEEEDELELANQQMSYGNVKEQRDVANLNKGNEAGWDMAKLDEEKAEESKTAGAKAGAGVKRQGAAFGEGTSWSKPSFGRKAPPGGTKFGKDDFAALDDLDDEDSGKKKDTKTRAEGGGQANSGAQREEKEEKRPVKPTFRGRMNLTKTGGGGQEDQVGAGKAYDFGVVYKSDAPEGEKREFGGEHKRRPQKDRGVELNAKAAQDAQEDDDFTIVRSKDKKKKFARRDSDSSSDDEGQDGPFGTRGGADVRGARVERGGNRGGRGGFFKSSNVKKQE